MEYTVEQFSSEEAKILNQFFTNIDRPVFGLTNLPEVVKGALFARYSRSPKSLRRLFLDEFYNKGEFVSASLMPEAGSKRAKELYDLIFLEYGDDSVAQLGGAHIACEQVSNILAKFIEKGRLAAYLEQSTRYVFYNQKIGDRYKFVTPAEIGNSVYRADYEEYISSLFDTYTVIIDKLIPHFREKYPNPGLNARAWENTLKAKACDVARGLLPASTRTNLGIYANGQTYEYLLIKMFSSDMSEVRDYAQMMLEELRKIIPSFLVRVDREDRGVVWSDFLRDINMNMERRSLKANESMPEVHKNYPEVELVEWDDDAIDKLVADALYESSGNSLEELIEYSRSLNDLDKTMIIKSYFGDRGNRRHKPGRAAESVFYKFDICSDYGAFRDLQRHRMLTVQWQRLTPDLGYTMPAELDEFPGLRDVYSSVIEKSRDIYKKLNNSVGSEIAQYAIPFACKMRYSINMNLREAFHLIELRTQKQGHSSYRQVCNKMYRLIKEKAGHDIFADGMIFVDQNEYEHAREDSEKKFTR